MRSLIWMNVKKRKARDATPRFKDALTYQLKASFSHGWTLTAWWHHCCQQQDFSHHSHCIDHCQFSTSLNSSVMITGDSERRSWLLKSKLKEQTKGTWKYIAECVLRANEIKMRVKTQAALPKDQHSILSAYTVACNPL